MVPFSSWLPSNSSSSSNPCTSPHSISTKTMAVYASLLSLISLIHDIQTHPKPPITLHQHLLQSLSGNAALLQHFLEVHTHDAIKEIDDGLVTRIAEAAYAVQDAIDAQILDSIPGRSDSDSNSIEGLQKATKDFDSVTREAMEIKHKIGDQDRYFFPSCGSERSVSAGLMKNIMVGFHDVFNEVVDKLTSDQSSRQVISIVGMGGIGKTTLASNAYENQLLVHHFDIRSWVTVSRNFNIHEVLLKILLDLNGEQSREELSELSEQELGSKLHKSLFGRRYLVVLDDIWTVDVEDEISRFFPDNNNRSRILITTRLSLVSSRFSSYEIEVNFLDDYASWTLFCRTVFGEEACPIELEQSGMKIVRNCNGLPLSITIIARLLARLNQTERIWVSFAKKMNSHLNLEYEKHCLQIIRTSYDHLPIHLKPCFLYLGVFPEDSEIRASTLIKLWVAEGFVKPVSGKSLELAAEEYLMDLIDRNLVLVKRVGSLGKIKVCNVHDLTRDLCIMEADKEKFLCSVRKPSIDAQQGINFQRRIAIHRCGLKDKRNLHQILDALQTSSNLHSLVCEKDVPLALPRMLRVLNVTDNPSYDHRRRFSYFDDILRLLNLRFIAYKSLVSIDHSITHIWNLQTLILPHVFPVPLEIWKMFNLRHVEVQSTPLADPANDSPDHEIVLQHLQTLSSVRNFRCDQGVINRIPNIQDLGIEYPHCSDFSQYCLSNLSHLHKLSSLSCRFLWSSVLSRSDFVQNITFPHSLLKLKLVETNIHWEDVTMVIGSLPNLEVLKLVECVRGHDWSLVEGKFRRLKYLLISRGDLTYWDAENDHFPCLEHLCLHWLLRLEEIPSGIGDAPMLQSIQVDDCSYNTMLSAQRIIDEQAEFGNITLKVRVRDYPSTGKYVELLPYVQPNFEDNFEDE